jgi:hypothetical protein
MSGMRVYVGYDCMKCDRTVDIPLEDVEAVEAMGLVFDIYCGKCNKGIDITLEQAEWLRERNLDMITNCKDCGTVFFISPEEAVWMLTRDLKLFRRCPECREKNKEKNDRKAKQLTLEEGLEEAARRLEET